LNITLRGLEEYPDHNRSYPGKYLPEPCPKISMEKIGHPISRKWGKKDYFGHSAIDIRKCSRCPGEGGINMLPEFSSNYPC
jgi:hypothetical protein